MRDTRFSRSLATVILVGASSAVQAQELRVIDVEWLELPTASTSDDGPVTRTDVAVPDVIYGSECFVAPDCPQQVVTSIDATTDLTCTTLTHLPKPYASVVGSGNQIGVSAGTSVICATLNEPGSAQASARVRLHMKLFARDSSGIGDIYWVRFGGLAQASDPSTPWQGLSGSGSGSVRVFLGGGLIGEHLTINDGNVVQGVGPWGGIDFLLVNGGSFYLEVECAASHVQPTPLLTGSFASQSVNVWTEPYDCYSPWQLICDGSGAGECPCGSGDPGHGCANDHSSSGARLWTDCSLPQAHIDQLTLLVDNSVPGSFGIFFQGTEPQPPTAFGNGLLCVGGEIRRLGLGVAGATGSVTSMSGMAAAGSVSAGDTMYYQWWYRDVNAACSSTFNASNAIKITWIP